MIYIKIVFLVLLILVLGAFASLKLMEPKSIYPLDVMLGIEEVPASLGQQFFKAFDRYTKITAPNGKPIHIVAQNEITNEQILRSRGILQHYLKDYPGSVYGNDKSEVANKMAENNAVLTLLNGEDDGNVLAALKVEWSGIYGQALFKNEIQVEGHPWYVNQDYAHRDAAFEEILHFVHDFGIGVDGSNTSPGVKPIFQREIREAQIHGLTNGLWANTERTKDWIEELDTENSLSQEYLAAVIDTYYGLWGAWKEADGGMWGIYVAKTRDELKDKDPKAHELMDNKFFHPYLTYNARIDAGFEGTFSLKYDSAIGYSHHSRYLKDITLLGSNNTAVRINELDNFITGNVGINTVIFSGNSEEYDIQTGQDETIITDSITDRDGKNRVRQIEKLEFADKTIQL